MCIRPAAELDSDAIAAIYAHHVLTGNASYELDPPSVSDMRQRLIAVMEAGWPYLVAEIAGEVVGYASASQFRPRAAYAYACEDSIYVREDKVGRGIGRALLDALVVEATAYGFRQMVAVIGGAEPASIRLHAACGFREAGRLEGLGWKHGRWLDSVYMQRALGPGTAIAP